MDTLSSKNFQPISPDGFVISTPTTETPKIEITETDNLCQSPLSPSGCDVPLSDWDDFHHHGDGTAEGDYLSEQSPRHQQHGRGGEGRGSSFNRRGDGGPGKSPSPSRNSPRRHSPVPYSPVRQHRIRNSASADDCADVSLSPRRHSPVSFSVERPCTLPLASSTPEEFICVSYSDPFSSPTLSHASEGILSISIHCDQDSAVAAAADRDDEDVDMTPGDGDVGSLVDGSASRDLSAVSECSVVDKVSASQRTSLELDGGFQCASSEDKLGANSHPVSVLPESAPQHVSRSEDGIIQSRTGCAGDVHGEKIFSGSVDNANFPSAEPSKQSLVGVVEAMEGDDGFDGFHVDEVSSSDSSSDDDMEGMMPPCDENVTSCCVRVASHKHTTGGFMTSACHPVSGSCYPVPPQRFNSSNASPSKCSHNQSFASPKNSTDSGHSQPEEATMTEHASDLMQGPETNAMMLVDSDQSAASQSLAQQSSQDDTHCSDPSQRRDSLPRPSQLTGQCTCSLSPCSSKETSPKKTLRPAGAGKTPEDFTLCRLVGCPPLHYPHCQDVVLVHCALPSPYDANLPTPPIVLTPHTSYDDLSVDNQAIPVEGSGDSCRPCHQDDSGARPDISRSRSFPKLAQDENDQFQEPHQTWPTLGGEPLSHSQTANAGADQGEISQVARQETFSTSGDKDVSETYSMDDESDSAGSGSLPASPSNSRVAVIGRLRRVVERRLSSTSDTSEAALQDG